MGLNNELVFKPKNLSIPTLDPVKVAAPWKLKDLFNSRGVTTISEDKNC